MLKVDIEVLLGGDKKNNFIVILFIVLKMSKKKLPLVILRLTVHFTILSVQLI